MQRDRPSCVEMLPHGLSRNLVEFLLPPSLPVQRPHDRVESVDRGAVVEFRLLGPVEVWTAGLGLEMGPPQQRAVLAALAVDAGRPVFRGTLIDRVWSGRAPEGAASALYAHVNRIRRMLAAGAAGEEPVRLARRSGGYVLGVDPEDVDLHRFRQLALAARDRQRPDDERAR